MKKKLEDEKKVNLIKCPLPKIIYMTMKGLTTYPKNSEKPSNINTYYTKKVNHQRGLPSLKMSTKVSFSPNKTNYTKGIITNKLNNNMNEKNSGKVRPSKNNVKENNEINKSKGTIKKQFMKDTLNSYGLNRYYEKFIQNGINEQNFNNIGFMNKKMFNDFINILNIFPGHTIKMEQLYLHLKKMNNDIIQSKYNSNNSQSNIHLNNSTKDINISNINTNLNSSHMNMNNNSTTNNSNTNSNNNLNYVTLTFNRANLNNLKTRVSQSQNKSKYRYINPTIKQKRSNSNRASSEQNKSKKHRVKNYSQRPNLGEKNKSKKKLLNENIISKYNFVPPKPISSGRNDLIKSFFKDLDNLGNNANSIYNLTNLNIFKSLTKNKNNNFNKTNNHSLTGAIKEINKGKKGNLNIYRTKYNEKHSAPNNNLQGLNQSDLPQIKNLSNRHIKINTQYSNSLIGIINDPANINMNIEMKTSYNKINSLIKANNDNKIDNYKNSNGNQAPYSIKTFFNDNIAKNKNKNNNVNYSQSNKLPINKKNIIKKSVNSNYNNSNTNKTTTSGSQRSNIEKIKRNSVGNGLRIKLPNVNKKIETQNSSKLKPINKNAKEFKEHEEGNKNMSQSSYNISYKNEISNKKSESNMTSMTRNKKDNENIIIKKIKDKENYNLKNANKSNTEKFSKTMDKIDTEENKKDNINININIEEKNQVSLIPKEKPNIIQEKISISNKNMSEPKFTNRQNSNASNNITTTDKNINSNNTNAILEKPENKPVQKTEKNKTNSKDQIKENIETLEDMIYESLRLNRSFSENKTDNIFLFDAEFLCRCLGLCLAILIETSKESPHITEINLEALSASEIKYFFFNDAYNDNINFLFDVFDKDVNTDINIEQISPLDKLECFLAQNNKENINIDISYLKHIKKEKDEALIKSEEEKEKEREKLSEKENQNINNMKSNINLGNPNREGFKIKTGFGDIERDIKFIDEFFSINNRKKKKAKNYNFISEMSKNILCKELSYINEIDSELNGTNSNINNTNINNNSNNNINEKNLKEENASNIMDNEEIKEIKEIQNNNTEEENNNTFNNEMNELGIINEANDDNKNNNGSGNTLKNNISNNSITIKAEEGNDINLNEDNKNFSLTINNDDNNNEKDNTNKEIIHKSKPPEIKINNINNNKEDKNKINDKNKMNLENNVSKEQNNGGTLKNLDISPNPQNSLESSKKEIKKEEEKEKEKNIEEDDIYELDYILDITSIDELTYYLIKRAEIFDEDFNYIYMKIIERRYIPTPEPQTIFDFIADIIILTKMEKEVIVLSLIYIERLIYNTGLLLTSRNWRRIVLTAMIISSKVWDDNSFENDHFSQVFANLAVNEINTLERIFLELINYKVYVKQSDYFKYLMMIKVIALKYNYNGREIVKASIMKNLKYQEFNETMQNRMRKKVTLNNSAQF